MTWKRLMEHSGGCKQAIIFTEVVIMQTHTFVRMGNGCFLCFVECKLYLNKVYGKSRQTSEVKVKNQGIQGYVTEHKTGH